MARPRNSRRANTNNNESNRNRNNERPFYATVKPWQPTSAVDAELMHRFTEEPPVTALQICINGIHLELPRYNGISWWFPEEQKHPLETFFYFFFTIVNSMQTASLILVPLVMMYKFGFIYVLLSLPLTVPLGSHLEETYGSNYGSAYTSLMVLEITFFTMTHVLQRLQAGDGSSFQPNSLILVASFIALLFALGVLLCRVEKHVLGRTWHAALIAYGQLFVWIYGLVKVIAGML
jgi:hypothetical protein